MTDESTPPAQEASPPRWQPLSATDRRVAGVLIEKAKTTPNAYPMSLNAICTACNQKSNRAPVMELEPDDVEESLDRLRNLGAMGLIEGYGRVQKYRHYLYDWLGVDKVEIAVMAELLLRGAQTIGELRGRAARMEPIRDLGELQPVLASLEAKGLVIPLTSEGRGQIVTHALFSEKEMAGLKAQYGGASPAPAVSNHALTASTSPPAAATAPVSQVPPQLGEALQRELRELRTQVAQMQNDLETLAAAVERNEDEMRRLRDELGG